MKERTASLDLARLDPDTWRQLSSILDEVMDLPPDEVAASLDRLCGADTTLRARVEAVLRMDKAAEGNLSGSLRDHVQQILAEGEDDDAAPHDALAGRLVGSWRLQREIGRGGMGAVYLAERADGQFDQKVAVKLLRRELDREELLARFRQERQILARLEHPHVARLLDGGVTDDGIPWFAMEHVAGTPITSYCEEGRLDLRAMLLLFLQVCDAVQYAHRSLVIHRDLKPGNILVSTSAEAKLLDFGIAKLLDPSGVDGDHTLATSRVLTPRYAAPEQVRGEPPTTATDVYALGVILYELLTGENPYRRATRTVDEISRAILEEEPEAPSARLRRITRGSRRREWARVIKGDIDNIVLTALRKEPDRRYSSAEALAEDVRGYLDGRPVRATGRTFRYVASKFLRRNRVPVAAAALVLVSLAGGLLLTVRERNHARLEARKALELKDFVLRLFEVSDPGVGRADRITARELLERGADRVERELKGQPAVQAEMWDLLGSVYTTLGLFPQAAVMYERSIASHRAVHPGPDSLTASSLEGLGDALKENGDFAAGDRALCQALTMRQRIFGERSHQAANVIGSLAELSNRWGKNALAESLYHVAIGIDTVTIGVNSLATAKVLNNYGMLLYYDDRFRDALPVLRRSLDIRRRVVGRDNLLTARSLDNVAGCLSSMGEIDSAIPLHRESLEIRRRWLPPDHPDIANALYNTGLTYDRKGDHVQAEALNREVIAIRTKALDPKDTHLAQAHNALATDFFRQGKLDSSEVHLREALRVWGLTLPPSNKDVLTCRNNLGVLLREKGKYDESERILREVISVRVETMGPEALDVAYSEAHLGRLLVLRGEIREAESRFRHAIGIRQRLLDPAHPLVADGRIALAGLLRDTGRRRRSLALYDSAFVIVREKLPPVHPMRADASVGKGRLLLSMNRAREAEPLLRKGLEIRLSKLTPTDVRIGEAQVALGLCLAALGKPAGARTLLGKGLPVLQRQPGPRNPMIAQARAELSRMAGQP